MSENNSMNFKTTNPEIENFLKPITNVENVLDTSSKTDEEKHIKLRQLKAFKLFNKRRFKRKNSIITGSFKSGQK